VTEEELHKQSIEKFIAGLQAEDMRIRSIARDEIALALREFVDGYLEALEKIAEQEASRNLWRRIKKKLFARETQYIAKEAMKETAETVIAGIVKGLKP